MPVTASIVIVCHGKRAVTQRCLESLAAALGPAAAGEIELVLVDNASPDDTLELLRAWSDRATVVALPENRNFSGGCNAGAAAARGEVLVFLNNDTIVGPQTLEPLVQTALEPGVGAAGLRLLYPDGTVQHAGVLMVANAGLGGAATPFHAFKDEDGQSPAARADYELDCVTAACIAIPKTVFDEVGGFDEGYRNGFEDIDLCLRIRTTGRAVVYRGDLSIVHDEGATRAGMDDAPNVERLLARWSAILEPDVELAAACWDAELAWEAARGDGPNAPVVVAGHLDGLGPAADEARGLLLALEAAGAEPGIFAIGHGIVRPRLSGALATAVARGRRRGLGAVRFIVGVPDGPAGVAKLPAGAWLRLPDPGDDPRILGGGPGGPGWIPPAIDAPTAAGPGGGGVLVSLPGQDLRRARDQLQALAAVDAGPIRLVPTVLSRGLAALVAETLPAATLLPVCSDERRWSELAATADVAVCLDADDRFERRALAAAAAGARPVVGSAAGPAAAVLGSHAIVAGAPSLASALGGPHGAADRALVAAAVRRSCDPATVGAAILRALTEAPAPAHSAA